MTHTHPNPYAAHLRSARQLARASAARHDPQAGASVLQAARRVGAMPARLELPAGAATRTVDVDGRVKLNGPVAVTEVLSWQPGALAVTFDGPWALLTQGPGMAGVTRRRNASLAHLVRLSSGIERICLAPAHVARLQLGCDRVLLTAPFPATGGLLLVAPAVALTGAPSRFTVDAVAG